MITTVFLCPLRLSDLQAVTEHHGSDTGMSPAAPWPVSSRLRTAPASRTGHGALGAPAAVQQPGEGVTYHQVAVPEGTRAWQAPPGGWWDPAPPYSSQSAAPTSVLLWHREPSLGRLLRVMPTLCSSRARVRYKFRNQSCMFRGLLPLHPACWVGKRLV